MCPISASTNIYFPAEKNGCFDHSHWRLRDRENLPKKHDPCDSTMPEKLVTIHIYTAGLRNTMSYRPNKSKY